MAEKSLISSLSALTAITVRRVRHQATRMLGGQTSRQIAQLELVRQSSLFDRDWYLETYPDVAATGLDPLDHFMSKGWREGRNPGPEFATWSYLNANADVARANINPLVHFIEFGHSEGRGAYALREPFAKHGSASLEFEEPAACLSFPVPAEQPVSWKGSCRLDGARLDCLKVEDNLVGYAADVRARTSFEAAVSSLALLSGYGAPKSDAGKILPVTEPVLLDCWYVNSSQLRTRWTSKTFPFVIRALQHDPLSRGALGLVGEGLVASEVDVVDVHLNNPYFPLLLAFAEPDGRLRSSSILAFPSLCRGGSHYAELVEWGVSQPPYASTDALARSNQLAERLLRLIHSKVRPAISEVRVGLERADGTGPLFQDDFRLWLEKVQRIPVMPEQSTAAAGEAGGLAGVVVASPATPRAAGGATLMLGPDMIPSIAALTEAHERAGAGLNEIFVPVLVPGVEYTQPLTLIDLPKGSVEMLSSIPGSRIADWPRLKSQQGRGTPDRLPVAAIRLPGKARTTQAELLMPLAEILGAFAPREPLTWLIRPKEWERGQLHDAVIALGTQEGASADVIAFIGPVDRPALSSARGEFPGRTHSFANFSDAAAGLETLLVGYVGAGVVLHDKRSAALFASILKNEEIATASCVLVHTRRNGKEWHAAVVDGGSLATRLNINVQHANLEIIAQHLWRSSYPVAHPLPDLWVSRSSRVQAWISGSEAMTDGGHHLITSLITASSGRFGENLSTVLHIPEASPQNVTRVETLCG